MYVEWCIVSFQRKYLLAAGLKVKFKRSVLLWWWWLVYVCMYVCIYIYTCDHLIMQQKLIADLNKATGVNTTNPVAKPNLAKVEKINWCTNHLVPADVSALSNEISTDIVKKCLL